jgi:hypothetical protein
MQTESVTKLSIKRSEGSPIIAPFDKSGRVGVRADASDKGERRV